MERDTQTTKILNHLMKYGHITAADAWEKYHIMRLAARITDLRREGVPIITNTVTSKGGAHYAVYTIADMGADDGER